MTVGGAGPRTMRRAAVGSTRFRLAAATVLALLVTGAASAHADTDRTDTDRGHTGRAGVSAGSTADSRFVGTAQIEPKESVSTDSDGDLWANCWADNDHLYAANGDGKGFSTDGEFADIAVSEISGGPSDLSGRTVSRGDKISSIWSGAGYNRKPTGMVCIGDTLYLAVQDLALDFNDVPAATIVKSTDGGRSWSWHTSAPMFDDHVFTTIWFADFGRGGADAPDDFVYAYGLDGNWRDSFDDTVEDPTDVFLARVPKDKVQDRKAWRFYTGTEDGSPTWSKRIAERQPVLSDDRRVYRHTYSNGDPGFSVIGQGGVLYDPALDRYLYTSWTEWTYEFYESPTPWGPWKHFLSKDFGAYPWTTDQYGGYGTTIPSKFLSADGRSMYVQSNVCPCAPAGTSVYHFSLRKLQLEPSRDDAADNPPDGSDLAADEATVPISKSTRTGTLDALSDGDPATVVDDFDDEVKSESWWGYTWPQALSVNRVRYTTGTVSERGGWFNAKPRVEVKDEDGAWQPVAGATITPDYPGDPSAGEATSYTIDFAPVPTDGVRLIGFPGGTRTFSSAGELAASYRTQPADPGFESRSATSAWTYQGTAGHGVDRGLGFEHSGDSNGWIRTSGTGFSSYSQPVPVQPGKSYTFSVWTQSSSGLTGAEFGVRGADGTALKTVDVPASAGYTQHTVTVTARDGADTLTPFIGFDGNGTDQYLQIDDLEVQPAG
ncbi:DUF4185 domain-containing protein [Microlunatus soli]|uniref:DUF4185 domain-containing protein n=1 Tax=Microlunatus soli TaxID=630515 RepID=A0A1H1U5I9_9ACTN|nr:DUF4185 domain-containing protein [Microlunatus soli]SDS67762.1 protein of unknown function [Microlunatus soli]